MELRRATADDGPLVWKWRNDPTTRRMFRSSHEVPWEEHCGWYENALHNPEKVMLIAEQGTTPVGVVRFDLKDTGVAEISINVNPEFRGRGLGKQILDLACRYAFREVRLTGVEAEIKAENGASLALFAGAGFALVGRNGPMHLYQLTREQFAAKGLS
jgi:RimJ/RimL family protein N-acetyltransferase